MRPATTAMVLIGVTCAMTIGLGADNAPESRQAVKIGDKTLVAWVRMADLSQRGGGVLSIGGTAQLFDAIVYGEIAQGRWMAGSNFFSRTEQAQDDWPVETADKDALVQIAIVYKGQQVTVYREGEEYSRHTMASPAATFTTDSLVVMGLRHQGAGNGYFTGSIEDARIYGMAVDAETIRSLKPNELTGWAPLGWWPFEDDGLEDRMGAYPAGQLLGGARVEGGRLHLDGASGCMVVRRPPGAVRARQGWPSYHIAALPDEGVCLPYDANGCIWWKGRYHLMYIFQRFDGGHCWGHMSSPDLLSWTYHPTALEPMPGDPDRGIFSGNAFINKQGVPMLCWMGVDSGVCVATALDDDLVEWQKHPANPVIPMPKEGEPGHGVYTVWDPYLWLEGDTYMCLLGGNRLPNERDTLYLCTSDDLVSCVPQHAFYEGDPSWRRPDEDCSCPDFFALDGRHVLMCISHAIGGRFYVGRFDGERFYPDQHVRMNWPGGMFFAPESLEDDRGRRIFWAWVTDPRVRPAQESTGSGFMSLPRVLSLDPQGAALITPAEELKALRREHSTQRDIELSQQDGVVLEGIQGAHLELLAQIDPGSAERVGLKVRCSTDEETCIWYDRGAGKLLIDMSSSTLRDDVTYGSPPFTSYNLQAASENKQPYSTVEAPFELGEGEVLSLRVFLDGPMLEVFANDRQCLTQVIYPLREDSVLVKACAEGGTARIRSIDAWEMAPLSITDDRRGR